MPSISTAFASSGALLLSVIVAVNFTARSMAVPSLVAATADGV